MSRFDFDINEKSHSEFIGNLHPLKQTLEHCFDANISISNSLFWHIHQSDHESGCCWECCKS